MKITQEATDNFMTCILTCILYILIFHYIMYIAYCSQDFDYYCLHDLEALNSIYFEKIESSRLK